VGENGKKNKIVKRKIAKRKMKAKRETMSQEAHMRVSSEWVRNKTVWNITRKITIVRLIIKNRKVELHKKKKKKKGHAKLITYRGCGTKVIGDLV